MAIANHAHVAPETIHAFLAQSFPYTHDATKGRCTLAKLKRRDYDAAVAFIEAESGTREREPGSDDE
jgi:hypothetical protein